MCSCTVGRSPETWCAQNVWSNQSSTHYCPSRFEPVIDYRSKVVPTRYLKSHSELCLLLYNLCCNLGKLYCLLWWLSFSINSPHPLSLKAVQNTFLQQFILDGSSYRSDPVGDKSVARKTGLSVHGFREYLLYSILQIIVDLKLLKVLSLAADLHYSVTKYWADSTPYWVRRPCCELKSDISAEDYLSRLIWESTRLQP